MARPSYFSRQFFIHKRFQGKFILLYSLSISGIVGLATYGLYLQIIAAVDKHLYRTHIKINQVGDFLVDLMFRTNFYTISAIVITVLIVSLVIFKGINQKFSRMDEAIAAMSQGDFSRPYHAGRSFTEIGNLASLLEQARVSNQLRAEQLEAALDDLERGSVSPGDPLLLHAGKDKLDELLKGISLP